MHMVKYVYVLSGDEREHELALAELQALAGGQPCDEKLVESAVRIPTARAGYVADGIELIAQGADVAEVCRELAARKFASERFAIEVRRIPRGLRVARHESAGALAYAIQGRPDLDHPAERFLAVLTPRGAWFGRTLAPGGPDWRDLVMKPYDCSSALPAQAARAVCNLFVRGGEQVVDPCCGTGSLLLHAAALGAHVTGFDINKKMVGATNKNLAHFGFAGSASVADAAELTGRYDLVLANVPYGNMSLISDEKLSSMVTNITTLAPRGAIITTRDISPTVEASGAIVRRVIRLPKFSVTRLIFLYER